jgi:DNA-directed RNA polymerase subunit RPC12/RpoP
MGESYLGPAFMEPHFYPCPDALRPALPEHSVHQGIRCTCGNRHLEITRRIGVPAVFARCDCCGREFKVYANADYPAGYVADDPTRPTMAIACRSCGGSIFEVGVGYEYPGDEVDSRDITWFTMVGKCAGCGAVEGLFEDETA